MKEYNLDPWSFLDFKDIMGKDQKLAPTWVDEHWRRLQAYKMLESFYKNLARKWMNPNLSDEQRASKREYGDPHLIVEQFLSSMLGDKFYPYVDGSTGENASEEAKAAQAKLNEWWKKERMLGKVVEQERQTLKLGDGVWVLGWSQKKNRPTVRVYDPGMFFPVWRDDAVDDEFPDKVHIAYEFERLDSTGSKRTYVRRITYELLAYADADDGKSRTLSVPWRENGSDVTCWMSDGTWLVNEDTKKVDDFDESKAVWRVQNLDLGYDFIPVIHQPCSEGGQEFWGVSVISTILQVFDDVINNDTDLQVASGITGSPVITVGGGASLPRDSQGRVLSYGPGTVYDVEEGSMNVLDMSRSLEALLKYSDYLLERVSINGRIPESLMGRIKPSEVPSGITLWLSFSAHSSFVLGMRQIREDKLSLLLRFVQRMWQKEDSGFVPMEATVKFGSYLPADKSEALTMVVSAMNSKIRPMSLVTAVNTLHEAGFSIEDATAEVERIRNEDYTSAMEYLEATADLNGARALLGLAPIADPTAGGGAGENFDPFA